MNENESILFVFYYLLAAIAILCHVYILYLIGAIYYYVSRKRITRLPFYFHLSLLGQDVVALPFLFKHRPTTLCEVVSGLYCYFGLINILVILVYYKINHYNLYKDHRSNASSSFVSSASNPYNTDSHDLTSLSDHDLLSSSFSYRVGKGGRKGRKRESFQTLGTRLSSSCVSPVKLIKIISSHVFLICFPLITFLPYIIEVHRSYYERPTGPWCVWNYSLDHRSLMLWWELLIQYLWVWILLAYNLYVNGSILYKIYRTRRKRRKDKDWRSAVEVERKNNESISSNTVEHKFEALSDNDDCDGETGGEGVIDVENEEQIERKQLISYYLWFIVLHSFVTFLSWIPRSAERIDYLFHYNTSHQEDTESQEITVNNHFLAFYCMYIADIFYCFVSFKQLSSIYQPIIPFPFFFFLSRYFSSLTSDAGGYRSYEVSTDLPISSYRLLFGSNKNTMTTMAGDQLLLVTTPFLDNDGDSIEERDEGRKRKESTTNYIERYSDLYLTHDENDDFYRVSNPNATSRRSRNSVGNSPVVGSVAALSPDQCS
jgi:hypothetical protein